MAGNVTPINVYRYERLVQLVTGNQQIRRSRQKIMDSLGWLRRITIDDACDNQGFLGARRRLTSIFGCGYTIDAMEKDNVFVADNLRFTLSTHAKSRNVGNTSGKPDLDRNAAYELASNLLSSEGKWPAFLKVAPTGLIIGQERQTRERLKVVCDIITWVFGKPDDRE